MNNIIKKTMKMNKTATKLKPGMTLIEITVVILVLLTLIAVLFIGANIYKKGADRAACILNIRNIHQAVRADQNLENRNSGDAIVGTILGVAGSGAYFETVITCPSAGGAYTVATTYPPIGTVGADCATLGDATNKHFPDPTTTASW
jgi:type II secretory pathway pseudopilin PulG